MNTDIFRKAVDAVSPHVPAILTAFGCTGVVGTAVLTARAVPKHQEAIAQAEVAKADAEQSQELIPLTLQEKAKAVWKIWVPPVACGAATCASIIGSSTVSAKRLVAANAAVAGGYLIEQSREELKDAIIEKFGPEAYDELRNHQAEKKFEGYSIGENPPADVIVGNVVPWATNLTGREVIYRPESDILDIERDIAHWVDSGDFVAINDILEALGFSKLEAELGERNGYDKNITGIFRFDRGSCIRDGVPCHLIILEPIPQRRYWYGG